MTNEFIKGWYAQQDRVETINRANGWWDDANRNRIELIMLIVTELAEAVEALRHGNMPSDHIPACTGEVEELADVVIRIMDYAAGFELPLAEAIELKTEFNASRGYKHGKAF